MSHRERERLSIRTIYCYLFIIPGVVSGGSSESSLGFEMSEADLAQRAKLNRLEKETREMEKNMEALRHAQAKVSELEKTNKKLYAQNHSDRKDIIKLREVRACLTAISNVLLSFSLGAGDAKSEGTLFLITCISSIDSLFLFLLRPAE